MSPSQFRRPGGTSIAEEDGSTIKWLAAAVFVGVVIVAVYIAFGKDDNQETAKAPPPPPQQQASDGDSDEPPVPPEPVAPLPTQDNNNPTEVANALASDLQAKRLWSSVEIAPGHDSVVTVRSAYCSDPGMRESIGELADRFKANGVTKVECYERHGSLAFEQPL